MIAGWEKLGLVRNVRKPTAEQIGRKLAAVTPARWTPGGSAAPSCAGAMLLPCTTT